MNAAELRIGNWILNSNTIYQITHEDFVWADLYKPIPLTEQWLKDFRLKQNAPVASREYLMDRIVMVDHYEQGFMYKMDTWDYGTMIKYVHQLQNLYFALTGKELTIK